MKNTKQIDPLQSVYSYYFPEIRDIITDITEDYPHDVLLRSVDPGLDEFHEPVIDTYIDHMSEQVPDLGTLPYRYTTAGSEAIFHVLSEIAATKSDKPLYILPGEYEGYAGYGNNLDLEFQTVSKDTDFTALSKGIFFISNPSAKDGEKLSDDLIQAIGDAGHEIIYDLTYVGLTDPIEIDVTHENISRVIVSLSKPFGLYYYRIGFCFSRVEMNTLEVNKWFKNILSHIIAKTALEELSASELVDTYKGWQLRAVDELSSRWGIDIKPSSVLLLARCDEEDVPDDMKEKLKKYKRADGYRFCLTPFFLTYESES